MKTIAPFLGLVGTLGLMFVAAFKWNERRIAATHAPFERCPNEECGGYSVLNDRCVNGCDLK